MDCTLPIVYLGFTVATVHLLSYVVLMQHVCSSNSSKHHGVSQSLGMSAKRLTNVQDDGFGPKSSVATAEEAKSGVHSYQTKPRQENKTSSNRILRSRRYVRSSGIDVSPSGRNVALTHFLRPRRISKPAQKATKKVHSSALTQMLDPDVSKVIYSQAFPYGVRPRTASVYCTRFGRKVYSPWKVIDAQIERTRKIRAA